MVHTRNVVQQTHSTRDTSQSTGMLADEPIIDITCASNRVYDNTGGMYNVSKVIDKVGIFNEESYSQYSPAYLSAGAIVPYTFFFACESHRRCLII